MGKIIDKALDIFSSEERKTRNMAFRALRESKLFNEKLDKFKNKSSGSGYYRGGRRGRGLSGWTSSNEDANEMLSRSLDDLRDDSNDLYANSALGCGAINTFVTNVVGTGLRLCPSIDNDYLKLSDEEADALHDQIEREYDLFRKTMDLTLQSSETELQQLVLRSCLTNGDIFSNMVMKQRKGVVYETCINLIEGHRISNPNLQPDTANLIMGVGINKDGIPDTYHYSTSQGNKTSRKWKELKAFDSEGRRIVLHIFRKLRVNQMRGVPILAPIIELIKKIDTYSQAELDAAVINSFFTVFYVQKEEGENIFDNYTNMGDETGATSSDTDCKLGPGNGIELAPGEDVKFADPARPNQNFEQFFQAVVNEIAIGLNLPKEVLMKAFNSSYSASRGAVNEAIKTFNELEEFLITDYCQPVYEAFLFEAVTKGRIKAEGFLTDPLIRNAYCQADWIGPGQNELDPGKAANAAKTRIELGISNEIIETQQRGSNFKNVIRGSRRVERLKGKDAGAATED